MPGQDADDDGREDGERVLLEKARKKALLVENRFIQEARLYESDLRPLHGTLVPKFYGLWIGEVPISRHHGPTHTKIRPFSSSSPNISLLGTVT